MSLADDPRDYIEERTGTPTLMAQASLEWHKEFGKNEKAKIVIWTDRDLTIDGGDGWNGLDATDMSNLDRSIRQYIDEAGAHMVDGFIVRQRRGILPPD